MDITRINDQLPTVDATKESTQVEDKKKQAGKGAILKSAADMVTPLIYTASTAEPTAGTAPWTYWAKSQVYMLMSEIYEVATKTPVDNDKIKQLVNQMRQFTGKLGPTIDKEIHDAWQSSLSPGEYIYDFSTDYAQKWIMPFFKDPGLADYISGGQYNRMNPFLTIMTALAGCSSTFQSIDKTFWGKQEISYFMPIYLMNFAFSKANGDPVKAKEIYQQFVEQMPQPVGNVIMYKAAYEKAQEMLKNFPTSWSDNSYADMQMKLALQDFFKNESNQ